MSNMKKIITAVLLFVICFTVIYLGGAFTNASFNIVQWGTFSRGLVAIMGIGFSAMMVSIYIQDQ